MWGTLVFVFELNSYIRTALVSFGYQFGYTFGAGAALRGGLRDSGTFGSVITKDHLIAFAAGAILAINTMLVLYKPKGDNSERLRKLEKDSVDYVQYKEQQAKKYTRIDSAYRYDMARLSYALDSTFRARATRPRPRINDADSLRRAILLELYGTRGERFAGFPPLPR